MTDKIDHKSRAHAVLSASSSARWLACPPSAVASLAYKEQDTAFTQEGTIAHEVAELIVRNELLNEPLGEFPEGTTQEMIQCAEAYSDYIQEQITSPDPLIMLERRVDFSPWVPDGFGTADCIIIQGKTMDVIDYKYGKGVMVSAVHNPQEMLYGLGAWNDYGFAYDIELVRLHIFQPRMGNTSLHEMTVDELMSWSEHVKIFAEMAAKGEGDYNPGEHCRFCPHAGRCKELNNVCSEYVNAHGLHVTVPILSPYELAEFLQMEPLVSIWLKRVKDQALNSMLNGEQIPGYKVVEGKPGNRKWKDEVDAFKSLIANGYSRDEITETKLLSPAAMEKAFGKKRAAELMFGLVDRAPGSPTIALESDKRQPYNSLSEAQKDFE